MIRIGIAGAGFMGKMHAACYKALQEELDVQIVAVADGNREQAEAIAADFGAQVYATVEEMISQADLNAVDICLPTYLHKETALLAMERDCHVFIEKPISLNTDEARALLDKQQSTKGQVMVGHCIRFWPEYRYLSQLIAQQTYGKVISAQFRRLSPRPDWGWNNWLHDEQKSGSAALDLHIHDVDFVRSLFGEPEVINSGIIRNGTLSEHIHSLYHYGDVVVHLEGGWNYPSGFPFEMSYTVHLERAVVVFQSNQENPLRVYEHSGEVLVPQLEAESQSLTSGAGGNIASLGGYYRELRYFIQTILSGGTIEEATLHDGYLSLALLQRSLDAARKTVI